MSTTQSTLSRPITVTAGNGKNYTSDIMLVDSSSITMSANTFVLETTESTSFLAKQGNYSVYANSGNINLESNGTTGSAIVIDASNELGGITLVSGSNGINIETTGPIIFGSNADINIGTSNTGNITVHSVYNLDLSSADISIIANDNLFLGSITGQIAMGINGNVTSDYSFLIDTDGRVIVNNDVSDPSNYQFQVNVDQESANAGYNGILLTSNASNVTPEFRVKYTNPDGVNSINTMGIYSDNNYKSVYRKYTGFQFGNQLITISGPEFEYTDIGRKVVFQSSGSNTNIIDIGTIILPPDNTFASSNLTVGGVYPPGSTSKIFVLNIDSNVTTSGNQYDTFRWSQDGGNTYDETFVPMTYANGLADIRYPLANTGVYVSFDRTHNNQIDSSWAVFTKRTAIVDSNVTINGSNTVTTTLGNVFIGVYPNCDPILTMNTALGAPVFSNITANSSLGSIQTFVTTSALTGYIGMETNSDLIFKTGDTERMRVTNDGSLVVTQDTPDARLHMSTNFNAPLMVNDNIVFANTNYSNNVINYQQNPSATETNKGGYVVVYESLVSSGTYNIYANFFTSNGDKLDGSFQVNTSNVTSVINQCEPHVAKSGLVNSDNYMVVWASQYPTIVSKYLIKARIYTNNNEPLTNEINITASDSEIVLAPRVAGLANGDYIITYIHKTPGAGTYYKVFACRYNSSTDEAETPFEVTNPSTNLNYVYPYVAALSPHDINVPGGYVITYLNELFNGDARYQVRYQVFNSSDAKVGNERQVSSTVEFNSQTDVDLGMTDGLVSIQGMPEQYAKTTGGFLICYQNNYSTTVDYATVIPVGTNVIGLSSGADGDFVSASQDSNTGIWSVVVNNVYRNFIQGEQIQFITNDGYLVEKVETVTGDSAPYPNTVTITLSRDPREIVLVRYTTADLSSPVMEDNEVWRQKVNTSELILDSRRKYLPSSDPLDFIRLNQSEFYAFRTLPVVKHNDAAECIVTWQNGSIPNVYYQSLNLDNGALVDTEQLIAQTQEGLRQTDPYVAVLKTGQRNNLGYVIAFGTSALDLSKTAVFQQLIGPYSNLIHMNNLTADFVVDNSTRLGLGTTQPQAVIHAKTIANYSDYSVDTADMILQTCTNHIDTVNDTHRMSFWDGTNTELARIKVKYSENYQDMNPQANYLAVYFKFDEQVGALSAKNSGIDSIQSNIDSGNIGKVNQFIQDGILTDFDASTCWTVGKINNCLSFDGTGYLRVPSSLVSNPVNTIVGLGAAEFTVSTWLKVPEYIAPGERMALISVGSNPVTYSQDATNNNFQMYLSNIGANITANIIVSDTTSGQLVSVYDDTPLNTNTWHNLVYRYSNPGVDIWLDGALAATNPTIALSPLTSGNKQSYIGANVSANGMRFRGNMDEMRMYTTSLSNAEIQQLYLYGSEKRAEVQIQTLGLNGTFTDGGPGFNLDDNGRIVGARFRNNVVHQLTGYIVCQANSRLVTGQGTRFTTDILVGDYLYIQQTSVATPVAVDTNTYKVTNIYSDYQLEIERPVQVSQETIFNHVTVRPSILTAFDYTNQIRFGIDGQGNALFGTVGSNTNLRAVEITGDGSSANLTGLVISNVNTGILGAVGSRSSDILFKTINTNTNSNPVLGQILVSHEGTSTDYQSQMQFKVSGASEVLDISQLQTVLTAQQGGLLIGPETVSYTNSIDAALKLRNPSATGAVELAMLSDDNALRVFGNKSNIAFYSPGTYSDTNHELAKIRVSQNTASNKPLGRIDFFTTNAIQYTSDLGSNTTIDPDDTNQRHTQFVITGNGCVAVHNRAPENVFQVSPRYEFGADTTYTETITGASTNTLTFSGAISAASGIEKELLKSGSVILNNGTITKTYHLSNIGSSPFPTTGQLTTLETVSAGDINNNYSIHYAGLNVNKYGLVGIGDSKFGNDHTAHYLTVSGNTAIKGALELFDNSAVVSASYAAPAAFQAIQGNVWVKDVSTGLNYVQLQPTVTNTRLTNLESNVSLVQSNISLLQSNVSLVQSNISLLQSNVSLIQSNVAILQTRVFAIRLETSNASTVSATTDHTVICDISSVPTGTIFLPATAENGTELVIKNISASSLIPNAFTNTGYYIDNDASDPVLSQFDSVRVQWLTDKWYKVG